MTAFLLTLVVGGGVVGDLLKAHGMRLQGAPATLGPTALARFGIATGRNAWFLLALAGYAISFFGFMALLSIRDVSFAVPATALGYALETLLARLFLHEQVSLRRWAGAALVVAGVALLA